jgi:hypothetical protein
VRALAPAAAFRASLALFKRRPYTTSALGLALFTSLASVCCGFGVIAAPWFACELLALLLSSGLNRPLVRSSAWLWAGLVQMVAVVLLTSVASLALMSLGPSVVPGATAYPDHGLLARAGQGLSVLAVAGGLVLSLTVYFEYTPAILIERGGGFMAALLESARLVSRSGTLRTSLCSGIAHGLPLTACVGTFLLIASRERLQSSVALGLLLMPLLVFTLIVGQGMMVASYLHLRDEVTDPAHVRLEAAPSKSGAALWAGLLSCVMLGPVAVMLALLKPALPRDQGLGPEPAVLLVLEPRGAARERYIPGTALLLRVTNSEVRVSASDGGGAGTITLPGGRVRAVRVAKSPPPTEDEARPARGESTFAVETRLESGRTLTAWVDEAGVRLDDSIERRLSLRLSPLAGFSLVLCFAWTALWIARSLPPQARIRRTLARERPADLDAEHERRLRLALRTRALGAAVWLVPPALGSLAVGLSALLR